MTSRTSLRLLLPIAAALLLGGAARAQDPAQPAAPASPTAEQRKQMAEIHRKMADCLLSDRSFDECRNEMHASCQMHMGPTNCPMMMGGGGMGMGMGRGMRRGPGMMGGTQPATPAPSTPSPEKPAE